MGPTEEAADPGPCDDRCEPGPGVLALRRASAPRQRGEMPLAPAQLIASYALWAVGTSPRLYDFLQPRNALPVRRVEPGAWPGVAAKPRVTLLSPQSPGSLSSMARRLRLAKTSAPHPFWTISPGLMRVLGWRAPRARIELERQGLLRPTLDC